ncbi:hypothetical protein BGZ80_005119, partial [Entomortierella chlamydospora]
MEQKFLAESRVPSGIVQDALLSAQKTYNLGGNFTKGIFNNKLSDGTTNLEQWTQTVTSNFHQIWGSTIAAARNNEAARSNEISRTGEGTDATESMAIEEIDNSKVDIRTCTVTLRQILRPDLT